MELIIHDFVSYEFSVEKASFGEVNGLNPVFRHG